MDITNTFQRFRTDMTTWSLWKRMFLLSIGILVLDVAILMLAPLLGKYAPFLAVSLSWFWFVLPGLLLSFVIVDRISWVERIPVSFVISIGISAPITITAILLRMDLDLFLLLQTGILILSLGILSAHRLRKSGSIAVRRNQNNTENTEPFNSSQRLDFLSIALLLSTILLVGILALMALAWPPAGDDVSGLPIFVEVLKLDRISGTEPFHGTGVASTPRTELMVWTYQEILTNRIAGVETTEFFANTRFLLVILSFLSTYTFLHQFQKNRTQVLFLLSIWSIFLLASIQADETGSDLISRLLQDKFMGWFVIVPIIMVFMIWFLESHQKRYLIGLFLVTFGAALVHPITITQAIMLIGSFGLVHLLIERSRKALIELITLGGVLLLCLVIPVIQYLRYTSYMPIELIGLGDAVEYGRISAAVDRYRLWLLNGGGFILHPSIILRPIILFALALLPFLLLQRKKSPINRLIIGSLILIPILLYVPPFPALAGLAVTPYLIWRLAWPIPFFAVLAIGLVAWSAAMWIAARLAKGKVTNTYHTFIPITFLAFAALLGFSNIEKGIVNYNERRSETNLSTCAKAVETLSYLNNLALETPVNVLASQKLNFCIPGYAALANVVEFRGLGTVNRLSEEMLPESLQRVEDVSYFNTTSLVDDLVYEAIEKYDIDYILLEKDHMDLAFQFRHLSALFSPVYEDPDFSIYAVKKPLVSSKIVEGNNALRLRQFERAQEIFNRILQEDPANVLAHYGAGLANEGMGDLGSAISEYQEAVKLAPQDPALRAWSAGAYILSRNLEQGIQEYRIAAELDPNRYSVFAELGRSYLLNRQDHEANDAFERVAELFAVKHTAAYYATMGRLYQEVNRNQLAAVFFKEAINIDPEAAYYVNLGRSLANAGKEEEAIQVYQEAIKLNRWDYSPHLDLGFMYHLKGQYGEAIKEYEKAIRLRPTNISGYILIGKALEQDRGVQSAIEKMEEYANLNRVLPGPHRGQATLYITDGELDKALEELDYSAHIQPKNGSILTAKGYLLMADNQLEAAEEAFSQALLIQPEQVFTRLGLSLYYAKKADFDLDMGQSLEIVRLAPSVAWSHLKLADSFEQKAEWQAAQDEIQMALDLEPENSAGYIAKGNLDRVRTNWQDAISNYQQALKLNTNDSETMVKLGEVYQASADFANAEQYYKQAIQTDGESIAPYLRLAEIYWQQGKFEDATSLEEMTVDKISDSGLALIKLAESYKMQGRIDEAQSLYERSIRADASKIAAYSALAQLTAEKENNPNAIMDLYRDALNAGPASAATYLAAGKFFLTQGRFNQAELILQNALSLPNASPGNYLGLSELQLQRGEREASLETLIKATEKFPYDDGSFYNLGNFYLNAGDYDQAETNFYRAVYLDPTNVPAYAGLSQAMLLKGDWQKANQVLHKAITTNPGSAEAYLEMGNFQEAQGSIDLAEEYFVKATDVRSPDIQTYRSVGQFYLRQSRYLEAQQAFQRALEIPGLKMGLYLDSGDLSAAMGQVDEAISWYQKAIPENRSDPSPHLALADLYQAENRWDEAIQSLDTALQIQPYDVEVNFAAGKLYRRLAQFDVAQAYLERAYTIDHNHLNSLMALAELHKSRGNWQEAVSYLNQAVEASPTNSSVYKALGETYQLSGAIDEAETAYTQGIGKSDDQREAYLARAAFFDSLGKWELAEADFESAWQIEPADKKAGLQLASIFSKRGDFKKALDVLSELENSFESDAEIMVMKGDAYASQAKWAEAAAAYQSAIYRNETFSPGYLGLARISQLLGNPEQARSLYRLAVDKAPDDIEAIINLGDSLQTQGDLSYARNAYQKALALDADNSTALVKLDQINRRMGKPALDLTPYIESANKAPRAEAFITLASLYQQRGDWNKARYWLEKATALEPYNPDAWLELGNHYQALGEWEAALSAYQTARNYDPSSSGVLLALGSVQETLGLTDSALNAYQQAIMVEPGKIDGYEAQALLLYDLGQTDQALQVIENGIKHDPGNTRGYQVLGELYTEMGDTQRAEDTYRTGLSITPGSAELYVSLGTPKTNRVLLAGDKLKQAQAADLLARYQVSRLEERKVTAVTRRQKRVTLLKLADAVNDYLAYQPKLKAAQRLYGQAASEYEDAVSDYQTALNLQPDNEFAWLGLGKLQLVYGTQEEAVEYFQRAVDANPNSILALGYLGNTYLDMNRTEDAVATFSRILEIDPNNLLAHLGISKAYQYSDRLDIQQATALVEHAQYRLPALTTYFRTVDK